ncbi:MAG TPA: hypothetical protein VFU05_07470, partial [Cyclobacteriaceae bacterium]|nr:hypothetical protein [Cyclobacteriaceae bacterium]
MKSLAGFSINYVFFAYVPPFDEDLATLQTEVLKKENKATDYLLKIFDSALDEARIEINFGSNGKQSNPIRDSVLSIAQENLVSKKTKAATKLAWALHGVSDERNGTGLFAILEGVKGTTTRLVLIRFKGDEGLYKHGKKLEVDYISEVFTKKSNHYKLAVYEDIVSVKSFWKGWAIDKQISANTYKQISFFWVEEFLQSKTALTPTQGTLQFSKIIRTILKRTDDLNEQEEIISGIVNLKNKADKQISVAQFCKTYLSDKVANRIKEEMADDAFYDSVFVIEPSLYAKELGKTVLNLQGGITAFIPSFTYKKHVTETENTDGSKDVIIQS